MKVTPRRAAPRQQRDALGRRLCRNCQNIVPKGRLSYCGRECESKFAIAYFPNRSRHAVFARDRGVCAICGTDTELLRRILYSAYRVAKGWNPSLLVWQTSRTYAAETARELGFPTSITTRGNFWQADHIHECARGGWGKGLENFRTLCTPCHKAETARLAAELAAERRGQSTLFPIGGAS